mgnify:CR=1 FL=1
MTVRIKVKKRCLGHEKPEGSKKAWKRFRRVLMALTGSEIGPQRLPRVRETLAGSEMGT